MRQTYPFDKLAVWALCLLSMLASAAQGQPSPVKIGMSLPLSGPAATYGEGLRHGATMAIARINAAGGINKRPIELIVLDDAGLAANAASNTLALTQRGVVALAGVYGAESAAAVDAALEQIASSLKPPLIGPVTGDETLRASKRTNLFFVRASITDEARAAMLHLDTLGITRYALLAQDGPLGEEGVQSMLTELARIAIRPVAVERLPVTPSTSTFREAVGRVCAQTPQALVLAVDAARAQAAVDIARSLRCAGQFVVFSEVGASWASQQEASSSSHPMAGALVTQVMPHPTNRRHPFAVEYQEALKINGKAIGGYPSMEGYFTVRLIESALRQCGSDLSPSCLRLTLENRSVELPGFTVRLGNQRRMESPFVEITLLTKDGRFSR